MGPTGLSVQRCVEKREFFKELTSAKNVKAQLDVAYEEQAWNEKIKGIYGQFTSPEVVKMVHPNPAMPAQCHVLVLAKRWVSVFWGGRVTASRLVPPLFNTW